MLFSKPKKNFKNKPKLLCISFDDQKEIFINKPYLYKKTTYLVRGTKLIALNADGREEVILNDLPLTNGLSGMVGKGPFLYLFIEDKILKINTINLEYEVFYHKDNIASVYPQIINNRIYAIGYDGSLIIFNTKTNKVTNHQTLYNGIQYKYDKIFQSKEKTYIIMMNFLAEVSQDDILNVYDLGLYPKYTEYKDNFLYIADKHTIKIIKLDEEIPYEIYSKDYFYAIMDINNKAILTNTDKLNCYKKIEHFSQKKTKIMGKKVFLMNNNFLLWDDNNLYFYDQKKEMLLEDVDHRISFNTFNKTKNKFIFANNTYYIYQ